MRGCGDLRKTIRNGCLRNIFNIRLIQTKENLTKLSKIKWPTTAICKNILELKGNVNKIIFLILGRKSHNWLNI